MSLRCFLIGCSVFYSTPLLIYYTPLIPAFYHFEVWKPYFHLGLFTFPTFKSHCLDYQKVLWYLFQLCNVSYKSHEKDHLLSVAIFLFLLLFFLFWCSKILSFIISFLFEKLFSHSLKLTLLTTNSVSFPTFEDIFIFP